MINFDEIIDYTIDSFDNPENVELFLSIIQNMGVTIHGDLTKLSQDDKQRFAIDLWIRLCNSPDEAERTPKYLH